MVGVFIEIHEHVLYEFYRRVILKLNISFTKLGGESCDRCNKVEKHLHVHENNICGICEKSKEHNEFTKDAAMEYQKGLD